MKSKIYKFLVFVVWELSGARFVWEKIFPPKDPNTYIRRAPTFFIWLTGIYIALFGISVQRYENRVDKIENRTNAIFSQLSTQAYKMALSRIPNVQGMQCYYKPKLTNPYSVFRSLFSDDYNQKHEEVVELLIETLESWKDKLYSIDLTSVNLRGANRLGDANFYNSHLQWADFQGAFLAGASFDDAYLREANFSGSLLSKTSFKNAYIYSADFREAAALECEQLCEAKTLYKSIFDSNMLLEIKKKCPLLLEESSTR